MKKLFEIISWPWRKWQEKRLIQQRLKEIKERDPFIYK